MNNNIDININTANTANTATACLLLLLLIFGCTPSVRYTRDQPNNQPVVGQPDNNKPSGQRRKSVNGADSPQPPGQSGWETAARDDADQHKSGWLAAALREADQDQPAERQEAAAGAKAGEVPRRLERVVDSYIGVPYKYGGTTRRGFDCSGFASAVYREVYGISLKRTSAAMWKVGVPVALSAARPGDLVFFRGGTFGTIDHVGIYMGNNRFAHSSSISGVIYSNLGETYHARRFAGIRRML